jgi:hypothetical protein
MTDDNLVRDLCSIPLPDLTDPQIKFVYRIANVVGRSLELDTEDRLTARKLWMAHYVAND